MSNTAWKPKNLIFFQNFEIDEIEFCPFPASPYPKKRNHLGFIDISPPLFIDTSMERSSRVLQHINLTI